MTNQPVQRVDLEPSQLRFRPATDTELTAYARRLRRGDRSLTKDQALTLAKDHETERARAYQQHRK